MTRMYDSLMQMGRWFGYRGGYLDLCRLYTTPDLREWFEWVALADQELRSEFDAMYFAGRTPKDYGLRVRSHPDGMIVTALNKSRFTTKMQLTFTGEMVQTAYLDKKKAVIEANYERTERFIATLGSPAQMKAGGKGTRLWKGVSPDKVASFLGGFIVHPRSLTAQGSRLQEYIEKQQGANGDLSRWCVALVSPASAQTRLEELGGQSDVGLPVRAPQPKRGSNGKVLEPRVEEEPSIYCLTQRNIITPSDGWIDLEGVEVSGEYLEALLRKSCFSGLHAQEERRIILAYQGKKITELGLGLTQYRAEIKKPGIQVSEISGRVMRELRLHTNGLLLIHPLDPKGKPELTNIPQDVKAVVGFAVSFPVSEMAVPVEYQVNQVFKVSEADSLPPDFDEEWEGEPSWL